MKLVSFRNKQYPERLGLHLEGQILDLQASAKNMNISLPSNMKEFLENWDENLDLAREVKMAYLDGKLTKPEIVTGASLLAPVPHPSSCRDAYAFRQHVAAARKSRGLEMPPEYDQYPVFYYTNHTAIIGPGEVLVEKDHLHRLDFELELAVVIGKRGKNIAGEKADSYVAGFTIMNDFSARQLQAEEMLLNLGPAKGKDFATAVGPWLVTTDELEKFRIQTDFGDKYDLKMIARHNGKSVSEGNSKDMNWTFAEIIERCSYGVEILPGDVIGSGTVGTGCYLELNGTRAREAKARGEEYKPVWLQAGDTIELEITGLEKLQNTIVRAPGEHSILARKKILQPQANLK
ncbi:MAG: fumarylacetoacetate hydrolase [candidate division Zixibacteria bacterium RBG_16_50_21]|nr:MAG: fumarylacetoacetate hydrolase [candidate division Zixibacteria bacterium RBG_16_50_21]